MENPTVSPSLSTSNSHVHTSAAQCETSLVPQIFINQLNTLISTNITHSGKPPNTDLPKCSIRNVGTAINLILNYFENAANVLRSLSEQPDIQWVFEGRHAIDDIRRCTVQISEYLPKFMTMLETYKEEREACRSATGSVTRPGLHGLSSCPPPTTSTPSLSRNKRLKAVEEVTNEKLHQLASKIESAITQLREIHVKADSLRERIAIAAEWAELQTVIMEDIETEIDSCFKSLSEIQGKRETNSRPNLALLSQSICESPYSGCKKLPYSSESERARILK